MSSRITRRWVVTLAAVAIGVPLALQVVAQSPASASTVPNATVVSATPVFDSIAVKTVDAKCPAGKKVIGGGVRVNAGSTL